MSLQSLPGVIEILWKTEKTAEGQGFCIYLGWLLQAHVLWSLLGKILSEG